MTDPEPIRRTGLVTDDAALLRATFEVTPIDEREWRITFMARSGKKGTASALNEDYADGLQLLLERLAGLDGEVTEALLDSSKARKTHTDPAGRRLRFHEDGARLALRTGLDFEKLRLAIGRAQTKVGRAPGSKGSGNNSSRIALEVRIAPVMTTEELARFLVMGRDRREPIEPRAFEGVDEFFEALRAQRDTRQWREVRAARRLGQSRFRKQLLEAYGGTCAATGVAIETVLDAAHIVAHSGEWSQRVQNGLLLRKDVHALFDHDLLRVRPRLLTIAFRPGFDPGHYRKLLGRALERPGDAANQPFQQAFELRYELIADAGGAAWPASWSEA